MNGCLDAGCTDKMKEMFRADVLSGRVSKCGGMKHTLGKVGMEHAGGQDGVVSVFRLSM